MKTHIIVLSALLIPATVFAQPTGAEPDTPARAQTDPPPPPVVVTPAPAPAPQPQYEEVTSTTRTPMFMTGALVFAASYGASVVVAASSDNSRGNDRLYVPVVGPWLALNDRGSCDITKSSCDHETTAKVLLIADGVFQAAGVLAMLDGIFQPTTHRVVRHTAKLDTKVRVTPTAVRGEPGLSVFGRF